MIKTINPKEHIKKIETLIPKIFKKDFTFIKSCVYSFIIEVKEETKDYFYLPNPNEPTYFVSLNYLASSELSTLYESKNKIPIHKYSYGIYNNYETNTFPILFDSYYTIIKKGKYLLSGYPARLYDLKDTKSIYINEVSNYLFDITNKDIIEEILSYKYIIQQAQLPIIIATDSYKIKKIKDNEDMIIVKSPYLKYFKPLSKIPIEDQSTAFTGIYIYDLNLIKNNIDNTDKITIGTDTISFNTKNNIYLLYRHYRLVKDYNYFEPELIIQYQNYKDIKGYHPFMNLKEMIDIPDKSIIIPYLKNNEIKYYKGTLKHIGYLTSDSSYYQNTKEIFTVYNEEENQLFVIDVTTIYPQIQADIYIPSKKPPKPLFKHYVTNPIKNCKIHIKNNKLKNMLEKMLKEVKILSIDQNIII